MITIDFDTTQQKKNPFAHAHNHSHIQTNSISIEKSYLLKIAITWKNKQFCQVGLFFEYFLRQAQKKAPPPDTFPEHYLYWIWNNQIHLKGKRKCVQESGPGVFLYFSLPAPRASHTQPKNNPIKMKWIIWEHTKKWEFDGQYAHEILKKEKWRTKKKDGQTPIFLKVYFLHPSLGNPYKLSF